jgi:putative transposase
VCRQGTIRNRVPSSCIVNHSQSGKTTSMGGVRGDEGVKKLYGRTRHLLVNTQRMVMWAKGGSAVVQGRAPVPVVLEGIQEEIPRLKQVWGDQGYTGSGTPGIEAQLS